MRWIVEYKLPGGRWGLMIFTANDNSQAADFAAQMIVKYGHTSVSDPLPIVNGIDDLYRYFPRLAVSLGEMD
jgi:hypothetical protein